ncbi:hypothetical protein BC936DRAFT_149837, partial [Jimgerdemannia flammicorona]
MPSRSTISRSISHLTHTSARSKKFTVLAVKSSDPYFDDASDGVIHSPIDRLDLLIHYCGRDLSCQIIFDPADLAFPPDVILPAISTDFSVSLRQLYGGGGDGQDWDHADFRNIEKLVERIRSVYGVGARCGLMELLINLGLGQRLRINEPILTRMSWRYWPNSERAYQISGIRETARGRFLRREDPFRLRGFECRINLENDQVPVVCRQGSRIYGVCSRLYLVYLLADVMMMLLPVFSLMVTSQVIFRMPFRMPPPITKAANPHDDAGAHNNDDEEGQQSDDWAYLNVHYYVPPVSEFGLSDALDVRVTEVDSQVELPAYWESKRDLKIPNLDKNTPVVSYYTELSETLAAEVTTRLIAREKRREFFEEMTKMFRKHLLECDMEGHNFMVFYFEVTMTEEVVQAILNKAESVVGKPDNTASALARVTVPESFPKDPPSIQLLSPVNFKSPTSHLPESKNIDIPYSPRWETTLMVWHI